MNNMNKISTNKALLCAACALALASCSDDHFDVSPEVSGRSTVWQNIQDNPELTQFADLLQRVTYSKSEVNKTTETYAQMLNSDQTFTVWAPKNGTFDYSRYDQLIQDGQTYTVEKELIANSMTRYTHIVSGADSASLELFNSKTALFSSKDATVKGQKITEANITSKNGVLHVTDGAISYDPNLYEYIKSTAGLDSLKTFLTRYEKYDFDEKASTQGPTVDGQITWVDSVSNLSNTYLSYLNAKINHEDSLYAMVMPSNEAWAQALQKTRPYYVYNDSYRMPQYSETSTSTTYTTYDVSQTIKDSLAETGAKGAIIQNTVFNARYQQPGKTYADFSQPGACDSLQSTTGRVFYDPESAQLFGGATPYEASNGYAYVTQSYTYPYDSWADELERSVNTSVVDRYQRCTVENTRYSQKTSYALTDSTSRDTTLTYTALYVNPTSASVNPNLTISLPQVLSTKYDIYVVMPPNLDTGKPSKFRATIGYHELGSSAYKEVQLDVPDGVSGSGKNFENRLTHLDADGRTCFMDTVQIARDFEFPVCYDGLDREVHPTLKIESRVTSSEAKNYTRELIIKEIILKAKEQ